MYVYNQMVFVVLIVSAAVSQPSNGGFREFSQYYHNYFRQKYGLAPLELNTELNILAHTFAEHLASNFSFNNSDNGYAENLWSHRGPLRPFTRSCRDAINNWFTGRRVPGNAVSKVDREVLLSNDTKYFGIGVGTSRDYTVVVANYD